ncbi:hypothetical protein B9T16_26590 [Arthrospira sp. PCC 8006]|uniref:phage head spike fiber domain-containing protein n=1 Tax=Arthrospira sp. PCC 8006 TaxID=1982224 RepID=UPI00396DD0A9
MTNFNIYSSKFGQSTDDLPEGEVNLYLTNERIQAVIDSNTYNVEPHISIEPTLSTQFGKSNTRYNGEEWITEPVTDTYTVTGASTATYVDATGKIRTATVNKPRYTFDPATGESLGLLIEEQRTNLLTWSEELDNAVWGKANLTVTANTTVAPDGTTTADSVFSNLATSSEHRVRAFLSMAVNTTYTASIFVKKITTRYAYIRDLTNDAFSVYDLYTGLVSRQAPGTVASMEAIGGYYRIKMTFTTPSSIVNNLIDFGCTTRVDTFVSIVPIGEGVALWGAQLEAGTTPSSYTPTQASTFIPDSVIRFLGNEFNPNESSFYIEYTPNKLTGVGAILGTNSDNTNLIFHGDDSEGFGIDTRTVPGGMLTYSSPLITRLDAPSFKILSVLEQGRQRLFINGDKVVDETNTVTSYETISQIRILRRTNGVIETGICKDFRYYPKALSESECLALTKL